MHYFSSNVSYIINTGYVVYQDYKHDLIANGCIYELAFFNSAFGEDASHIYSVVAVFCHLHSVTFMWHKMSSRSVRTPGSCSSNLDALMPDALMPDAL